MTLHDSGEREKFGKGGVRDTARGKIRFSLVPWGLLRRVAEIFTLGAAKYDDYNWQRGIPISRSIDSFWRHYDKWIREVEDGEDHGAMMIVNIMFMVWTYDAARKGYIDQNFNDLAELRKRGGIFEDVDSELRRGDSESIPDVDGRDKNGAGPYA